MAQKASPFRQLVVKFVTWNTFFLINRYRGVTVLLPGWVIRKYWNYPCKFFSLGSWLVSALSTPNGGEGYNSSTDLNPNTMTSIQLQCIQASRPHLADKTTSKPQPKYCMYQSSPRQTPYCTYTYCTASYRPFLSKETPAAIRDT